MTTPVVLTIAGSDSSGGAGIQADLRTFTRLGLYGATAITAVTAQNSCGVQAVHVVPVDVVLAQAQAALTQFPVRAVKTGMLATSATVEAIGALASRGQLPRLVVDPVLVSSSGHPLVDVGGIRAYLDHLLPYAAVVTPNIAEAGALLGSPVRCLAEMREAAAALAGLGPAVIVTGGDLAEAMNDAGGDAGDDIVDVVCVAGAVHELRGPRVRTRNTHGTGCTFSAALAALLAGGDDVLCAAAAAKRHVRAALEQKIPTNQETR